jgi:hypothetical protein
MRAPNLNEVMIVNGGDGGPSVGSIFVFLCVTFIPPPLLGVIGSLTDVGMVMSAGGVGWGLMCGLSFAAPLVEVSPGRVVLFGLIGAALGGGVTIGAYELTNLAKHA